ncbi:MAG TPA: three-Cys-motif partner protein TcmP [Methylomirabilota bacterium]|nr:three-Cys-motif partner protein TcmP [Methylomirabilota bacterium]
MESSDGLVVRESGRWVKDKLYYLEHYLKIFSVGMHNKWLGKLYYVDLFSGPGRCFIRETREEVDGSPLIALKYDFANYFFFENDPACYDALVKRIKTKAPDKIRSISVIQGNCNDEITRVKPPASPSLGLAFIDPTGISQLSFDTIRTLVKQRKMDLIINFPEGMAIRMNLHQYRESENTALDTFMGSDRWREQYKLQPTSFDQVCRLIAQEYLDNLRRLGYEVVDGSQVPVRTEGNTLLYYLLFASKNPKGNEFWKKIGTISSSGQRKLSFDFP